MKTSSLLIYLLILSGSLCLRADTAEQEKAFVDKYKTALEANNSTTLQSFLYTTAPTRRLLIFTK
jgi:hypothetical protein